ncbi:hypothetical protein SESBI_30061 [Sesbania bispinosa]|nr:hypothetical protein SESBI_30061 [Sesbania bispinosa]
MDWYYRSGDNDFQVPKDQELLDRNPSSDCWSNWGISATEGFKSPKKFFIMDFIDESFNNQIELESSLHDKDQSSSSSVCGGLPEQSFQQTALSCDQPNYQLQDLSRFEQMNDIFLDSVPEDLPCVENLDKSFNISPENQCSNTPGGLQKDIAASKFVSCNSESKEIEAPSVKVLDSFEQCSRYDGMHEQPSHEEFILKDLQMVLGQLTEGARICFRDALYRLARNAEQQHLLQDQDGDLNMQKAMPNTEHNETVRYICEESEMNQEVWKREHFQRIPIGYQEKEPMESETNSTDREIANLMFKNMEFNTHGPPLTSPVNSVHHVIGIKGLHGKCSDALNLAQKFHYPHPQKLPADAEVRRFGLSNQQRDTGLHIACGDPMKKPFMLEFG